MFKTFRNKVFAIYFLSIMVLLTGSLAFVYLRSYSEMESSINQRLSDKGGPVGHQQPISEIPKEEKSQIIDSFDFDEARDITIYQNEDFEQKLNEYLGAPFEVDYQSKIITSADETYVFREENGVYKVVKVTYDLQYIDSLKTTLIMFGLLVMVLFGASGFILINKLVKPLEQSYVVQNRFVSDASHELKTPLAIIKSCLQLISKGDEDFENLLAYCQDETERLIRLTSDLLQLSENDKTDYDQINLSKILELLVSGIEVNMFEKGIKLRSEIQPQVLGCIASDDITQLTHILIDNAVKYNDERKKVELYLSHVNRNIELTVINSADLIMTEDLEHLFDRFYQIENSRTEKGFGLGLALAKHICEKYNGEIKANYSRGLFAIIVKIPAF